MGPARLPGPFVALVSMLFSVALTFLGLTCVTFFIGRIIPIDPVLAIVGDKASRATYDRVAAEIGVNLPIPVQYWRYLIQGAACRFRRLADHRAPGAART